MKNNFIKYSILVLFSFTTLFSTDLEEIKKNGQIRHLGVPYANFITGSGDGLSVELVKGFAKYLNVEYKFVPSPFSDLIGDLSGKNVKSGKDGIVFLNDTPIKGDIIATGLTILDWRKEVIDFSTATFPSGVWLIARADSSLKPIIPTQSITKDISLVKNLLSGKSVLAIENTCLDPMLYNMKETNANIKLQSEKMKISELVPAILNNNAETTMIDVADALIALEKWPEEIKVIGPISGKQEIGAAFRKTSPKLREEFNKYFEEIKKDGSYVKLVKKYYPDVFYYYGDFFKK